jgi:hypothetical protein
MKHSYNSDTGDNDTSSNNNNNNIIVILHSKKYITVRLCSQKHNTASNYDLI